MTIKNENKATDGEDRPLNALVSTHEVIMRDLKARVIRLERIKRDFWKANNV